MRRPEGVAGRRCDDSALRGGGNWLVGRELLPDAWEQGPRRAVVAYTAIAFALMLALQLRLGV